MTPAATVTIHTSARRAVITAATNLLSQCARVAATLPPSVYTTDSRAMAGGTIGKHLRHVLDHYHAIIAAAEAGTLIDYDHRERDVPMEANPALCVSAIESMLHRLSSICCDADLPLRIRVMVAADGTHVELASTFARELAFATHHAVHHQAMIAAIAREFGLPVDPGFGKAPSTLRHEDRTPGR